MCVGFWSLDHPEYALILCSNRDEYLSRPTANAYFHSFGKESEGIPPQYVLSGRDLTAGGTWFGMNRRGQLGLLTNITEPPGSYTSSRGHLLSTFLLPKPSNPSETSTSTINNPSLAGQNINVSSGSSLIEEFKANGSTIFAGFNMILMTPIWQKKPESTPSSTPEAAPAPSTPPILQESMPTLSYSAELVTNCGGGGALGWRALQPDELTCGGISNGVDCSLNSHQRDTLHGDGSCGNSDSAMNSNPEANDSAGGPSDGSQWPKVRMGRTALERLLADLPDGTSDTELANKLFELLTKRSAILPLSRAELRNSIHIEPIPVSPTDPVHGTSSTEPVPPSQASPIDSTGSYSNHRKTSREMPISTQTNAINNSPEAPKNTVVETATVKDCDKSSTAVESTPVVQNSTASIDASSQRSAQPGTRSSSVGDLYGTRLSTVVLIKRDGQVLFVERDIWQLSDHHQDRNADPGLDGSTGGESGVRVVRSTTRNGKELCAVRQDASSERVFRFRLQL